MEQPEKLSAEVKQPFSLKDSVVFYCSSDKVLKQHPHCDCTKELKELRGNSIEETIEKIEEKYSSIIPQELFPYVTTFSLIKYLTTHENYNNLHEEYNVKGDIPHQTKRLLALIALKQSITFGQFKNAKDYAQIIATPEEYDNDEKDAQLWKQECTLWDANWRGMAKRDIHFVTGIGIGVVESFFTILLHGMINHIDATCCRNSDMCSKYTGIRTTMVMCCIITSVLYFQKIVAIYDKISAIHHKTPKKDRLLCNNLFWGGIILGIWLSCVYAPAFIVD
jgi:hypothetical protein